MQNKSAILIIPTLCISTLAYLWFKKWKSQPKRIDNKCLNVPETSISTLTTEKCPEYTLLKNKTIDFNIYVVYNSNDAQLLLEKFQFNNEQYIGLDLEWTQECLLSTCQLCSSKVCIIIANCENITNPPSLLIQLLLNPKIIKSGVGIDNDCYHIYKYWGIKSEGILDLRKLASHCGHTSPKCSLKYLSKLYIPLSIDKNENIQIGDWNEYPLSLDQIKYASEDAYCSYKLLHSLYKLSCSSMNEYTFICQYLSEINYSNVHLTPLSCQSNSSDTLYINTNKQQKKKKNSFSYSSRKEPLYENCQVLAPDNELLFLAPKKKVLWYLSRNLAEKVSDSPFTIRLLFEPHGRGHAGVPYYLSSHDNRCVVCGKEEQYVRHSIVPHRYRTYLPNTFKSHSSHDIVLLCIECNVKCNQFDDIYGQELETQYNVIEPPKVKVDNSLYAVIRAAKALYSYYTRGTKIPEERRIHLDKTIHDYCYSHNMIKDKNEPLTVEQYHKISNIDPILTKSTEPPVEKQIVDQLLNSPDSYEALCQFVFSWRQHFIDVMHPKFMASHWSVTTPLRPLDFDMSRGKYSRENKKRIHEERKREGWIEVFPSELSTYPTNSNTKSNQSSKNNSSSDDDHNQFESTLQLNDVYEEIQQHLMNDIQCLNGFSISDSSDNDDDNNNSNQNHNDNINNSINDKNQE